MPSNRLRKRRPFFAKNTAKTGHIAPRLMAALGKEEHMLFLKLILAPLFILLISLSGRIWGPSTAGLLAGLPVVGGPILFFIAFENDPFLLLLHQAHLCQL
ncbi:hypothetical protein P4S70_00350 [Enterovibrio sp. Hal110]